MTNFIDAPETPIERAARRLNTLHHTDDMPRRRREARVAAEGLLDVEEMARVDAETTRCSWSIPQDGHPYNESCRYKRYKRDRIDGQVSHGACWDAPYARAEALRAALLGEGA